MSEIYVHTKHVLPADGKDLLSKLRSFLVARGWVSEHYYTSCTYAADGDGTYSFAHSGTKDFLQIASTGYGSPGIRVRFWLAPDTSATQVHRLYYTLVQPTVGASWDENSSTNPYRQDVQPGKSTNGDSYFWMSLPSTTFNEVHFTGNDKAFLVCAKVTSTALVSFFFGLPELFTEYQSSGEFQMGPAGQIRGQTWDDIDDGASLNSYWFDPRQGRTAPDWAWLRNSWRDAGTLRCTWNDVWNNWKRVSVVNGWTGKRVLYQPLMLALGVTTSGVWEPVGFHPIYDITVSGLGIGDEIDYGAETYITFPHTAWGANRGYAMRIA